MFIVTLHQVCCKNLQLTGCIYISYFITSNIGQTDSIIYPPEGDLSPGGAALVTFDPDLLEAVSKISIVFNISASLCESLIVCAERELFAPRQQ